MKGFPRVAVLALVLVAEINCCSLGFGQEARLSGRYSDVIAAARHHYSIELSPAQLVAVFSNEYFQKEWSDADLGKDEFDRILNPFLNGSSVDFERVASFVPSYEYIMSYANIPPFTYKKADACQLRKLERHLVEIKGGKAQKSDLLLTFQRTRRVYRASLYNLLKSKSYIESSITPVLDAHYDFAGRGRKVFVEQTMSALEALWEKDPHVRWSGYRESFWSNKAVDGGFNSTRLDVSLRSGGVKWSTLIRDPSIAVDVADIEIKRPWFSIAPLTTERWSWSPGAPRGSSFLLSSGRGLTSDFYAVPLRIIAVRSAEDSTHLGDAPIHFIGYVAKSLPKLPP